MCACGWTHQKAAVKLGWAGASRQDRTNKLTKLSLWCRGDCLHTAPRRQRMALSYYLGTVTKYNLKKSPGTCFILLNSCCPWAGAQGRDTSKLRQLSFGCFPSIHTAQKTKEKQAFPSCPLCPLCVPRIWASRSGGSLALPRGGPCSSLILSKDLFLVEWGRTFTIEQYGANAFFINHFIYRRCPNERSGGRVCWEQ